MATNVRHDETTHRYVLEVDGEEVGIIDYERDGDTIDLTRTVIDTERREKGLGGELVQGALDQIAADDALRVKASCPFVAHWIEENPGYEDLLER